MDDAESRLHDQSGQTEKAQIVEASVSGAPPGGLYAAYGAVTAGALAGAMASRNPRRRAYLRHVVLTAALFVCIGVAVVMAAVVFFD